MMETKHFLPEELTLLSFNESCRVSGGSDAGWDYTVASQEVQMPDGITLLRGMLE